MKIVKYLFFLVLLVFIGSAIYFGTKDGTFSIRDSKTVEAPLSMVFSHVNNLEKWETWNIWNKDTADFRFHVSEKTTGEGAAIQWEDGEDKDEYQLTTTKVIPEKEIVQQITYSTFFGERTGTMIWTFEEVNENTKIDWIFEGEHTLTDKIYQAFSNKNFKNVWTARKHRALENLDTFLLKSMDVYAIYVDGVTHYSGGYYLFTSSVAKTENVYERMVPMLSTVQNFIAANNIRTGGAPFILYNELDTVSNNVIFSVGIPVRERIITPESSTVVGAFQEAFTAVKTTLKGKLHNVTEAYREAEQFMRNNGYVRDESRKIVEVFSINKQDDLNPAQWVTEIYIPILPQPQVSEL